LQSYIVRVYRRDAKNPRRLVGVIEEVGGEGKQAFNTPDELWQLMTSRKRRGRDSGRSSPGRAHEMAERSPAGKNSSGGRPKPATAL
jgi:hypothetical protein